jgi:hypothetical protein
VTILPFRKPDPGPHIEPCRLCAEQGRTFDMEPGLPIFKRFLDGDKTQACLLCDGTGPPDYRLI